MGIFVAAGIGIYLPAVEISPRGDTRDLRAWQFNQYVTVRVYAAVHGVRVHTDGRAYPGRPGSRAEGAWAAIGDIIENSTEIVDSRALPGPFTRVGAAVISPYSIINVGVCSPLFGNVGGGVQAEYMHLCAHASDAGLRVLRCIRCDTPSPVGWSRPA
jgi:hypothetical protein